MPSFTGPAGLSAGNCQSVRHRFAFASGSVKAGQPLRSRSQCAKYWRGDRKLSTVCQQQPDAPPLAAGMPVATDHMTTAGQQLFDTLLNKPAQFVPSVAEQIKTMRQPATPSFEGGVSHRILLARLKAVCEDIIYCWALAEAFIQDAAMQQGMREMLGRGANGLLAEGVEQKQLQTQVQLVSGVEGQYMLGCCSFSASQAAANTDAASDPPSQAEQRESLEVRPALDPVFASPMGQQLLAAQGDSPARMNRNGAARTYSTYCAWGYFNRRMFLRRELGLEERLGGGLEPQQQHLLNSMFSNSRYGSVSTVWRFFENVPPELSEFRTPESSAVADLHLRTLFGDIEKNSDCITTLNAWRSMCEEGRHFGRALFDAETVVLDLLTADTTPAT